MASSMKPYPGPDLNAELWRSLHDILMDESGEANLRALYRRIFLACETFLRGHPLATRVEAEDLKHQIICRRIRRGPLAPQATIDAFLAVNSPDQVVARMARWATHRRVLLGAAQEIAGDRGRRMAPDDDVVRIRDDCPWLSTADGGLRRKELTIQALVYLAELSTAIETDDEDCRIALEGIVAVVGTGLERADRIRSHVGMPAELHPRALKQLMEAQGIGWTYERARNVSNRLTTAFRKTLRRAEKAGFQPDPEGLWAYLMRKWKQGR